MRAPRCLLLLQAKRQGGVVFQYTDSPIGKSNAKTLVRETGSLHSERDFAAVYGDLAGPQG